MLRKSAWLAMTVSAVLVAGYALSSAFAPGLRTPFVADLFAAKSLRTFAHLAFGGTALVVGALQFSVSLRIRKPQVHRLLGKVYLVMVAISGISALLLAPTSTGGITAHFGFGMLAVLWLGTSFAALVRVRAADYAAHREWMIRSYALCLAAVSLRIYLPMSVIAGIPFAEAYPAISWLCWVPNLVIAEWFFVRSSFAPLERAA